MIWILGFAITFFTLLSGGLLLKNTKDAKSISYFLGLIGFLAITLYIFHGNPLVPDHPYNEIQKISAPKETLKAFDQIIYHQEIVQKNPQDDTAWFTLGNLYKKTKQFYKAALVYREAWKIKPTSYTYKLAYTQALILFNNMKLSLTTTNLLNELHTENPADKKVANLIKIGKKNVE